MVLSINYRAARFLLLILSRQLPQLELLMYQPNPLATSIALVSLVLPFMKVVAPSVMFGTTFYRDQPWHGHWSHWMPIVFTCRRTRFRLGVSILRSRTGVLQLGVWSSSECLAAFWSSDQGRRQQGRTPDFLLLLQ